MPDFSAILTFPEASASCLLPDDLCVIAAYDPFLIAVTAWATLQLLWTIVLLASQLYQVVRQMTTFEVSNLGRYGFMGGRGGTSLSSQMGHRHQHAPPGAGEEAQLQGAHAHVHVGCIGMLLQLTGLEAFTRGRAADGLKRASKASNPFDLGLLANCRDFWTKGRELGVEYERLYDVPIEGFREARRRREKDEDGDPGSMRKPKSHFMGFSLGLNRTNRAGYEPVSQV